MPSGAPLNIVQQTIEITKGDASTGWCTTASLDGRFGEAGKILQVKLRLDATDSAADTADTLISSTQSTINASTADEDLVYKDTGTTVTGSATAASLDDNVAADGGAAYTIRESGALYAGINVATASAGPSDSKFYLTVIAEVWR